MNYNQLMKIMLRIEKDVEYVLTLKFDHYDNRGRKLEYLYNAGQWYRAIDLNDPYGYNHTELKMNYYNNKGKLVQIDDTFEVDVYGAQGVDGYNTLTEYLDNIRRSKQIRPFIEASIPYKKWSYNGTINKIVANLDKCQSLDQLSQFILKHCWGFNDKPIIASMNDMVVDSSIKVRAGKCNDTAIESKVFDYIDVEIPLVSYGYSKNEIINIIKKK